MKLKRGDYYVVQFITKGWLEPCRDDRVELDDAKPIYRVNLWRRPK